MARLKHRNLKPPRGFRYYQRETQLVIESDNLLSLAKKVCAHRRQRGLEPTDEPTVMLEIERQMCTRLGTADCRPESPNDGWVPQKDSGLITVGTVLSASKAAFNLIESGFELAPMEEVNRRAADCLGCPLNQPINGCACAPFYKLIEKLVPNERRIPGLFVCLACSCSLQCKVNLLADHVFKSNQGRDIRWPEGACWQRTIMDADKDLK